MLAVVMWSLVMSGITYWSPVFTGDAKETTINILSLLWEGYLLWWLKDLGSMYLFHEKMHSPKWYWLHKFHHSITKEMINFYGGFFDIVDLLIENAMGTPFLLLLRYLVVGKPEFHLGIYIVVLWLDYSVHMCNPYNAQFLNPVLDYTFRVSVCHSMHHALANDYYQLMPFHHILPGARAKDLERFNKLFDTTLDVY